MDSSEQLPFHCVRCGHCCSGLPGYVWISLDEMNAIAAHLSMPLQDFTGRYVRRIEKRYSLMEKVGGECVFYEKRVGCNVYAVRPNQCRKFPFDNNGKYHFPEWMLRECEGLRAR